jgi:hypothetical protein
MQENQHSLFFVLANSFGFGQVQSIQYRFTITNVFSNYLAFLPVISSIDALIGNVWVNYAIFKQRIVTISNYQSR